MGVGCCFCAPLSLRFESQASEDAFVRVRMGLLPVTATIALVSTLACLFRLFPVLSGLRDAWLPGEEMLACNILHSIIGGLGIILMCLAMMMATYIAPFRNRLGPYGLEMVLTLACVMITALIPLSFRYYVTKWLGQDPEVFVKGESH